MAGNKLFAYCFCLLILIFTSCSEFKEAKPEEFFADSNPPKKQVFRWSNGQMPKSFDPSKASAPPETDIVRAIYDGLTETETKTLKAIPSIASEWSSSKDNKTWTFTLRQDAKWSNGESVTANDFVTSWKRLAKMGEEVRHHELLNNIVGMKVEKEQIPQVNKVEKLDIFSLVDTKNIVKDKEGKVAEKPLIKKDEKPQEKNATENDKSVLNNKVKNTPKINKTKKAKKTPIKFGVKAEGKHKLVVTLIRPDKSFPELVAHPIFRPVFAGGKEFEDKQLNAAIVTNGAFRIFSVGKDGITLDRADYYYNKESINLERVRFVPSKDPESALKAYKAGDVDAVTNAQFEPLALKLLTPYIDFQRRTHSALNFYEFNRKKEPYNDRRVRQALSISINRKRLTEDEMEGATRPAFNYLPFNEEAEKDEIDIDKDITKAKKLLETAGYEGGDGFPTIQLVINRNNIQQKIAKSIAKMWKNSLNVETNIIVKEFNELETIQNDGDFDLIRRGVVLPTSDETANMLAIFSPKNPPKLEEEDSDSKESKSNNNSNLSLRNSNAIASNNLQANINTSSNTNIIEANVTSSTELKIDTGDEEKVILTEEEAVLEVPAIPLYFPTSYSLVKPYVLGFEINTLDAPLLKDVRINNNWQPKKSNDESQK